MKVTHIVLVDGSITIPGDERSRTNPGHGYPEHTKHFVKLEVFDDIEKMSKRLVELKERKETFRVFKAEELEVGFDTTASLKVKE